MTNALAAHQILQDWANRHSAEEIMQFAIEKDVVMGIVHEADGIEHDLQVRARANLVDVRDGAEQVTLVAPTPLLAGWARPMHLLQRQDLASVVRELGARPPAKSGMPSELLH